MINVSLDSHTVEDAKRGLINQLKLKLDHTDIETVCREQYGIKSIKGYEYKDGDIVIDNNQVAFKLDFEVRFPISILVNDGGDDAISLSEKDVGILSGFNNDLDGTEPQETQETMDDELPDIEFDY
ncbi:MAG: hypothetical protein PVI00_17285 [Desulfobacterales bacterium]|jgi:hypothetical protein